MLTTLVSLATLLPLPLLGSAPSIPPSVALAPVATLSLAARADEKEDDSFLDLFGWREVTLMIPDIPKELKGAVTESDLRRWVSTPLKDAGLEILDDFDKSLERFVARAKDAKDPGSSLLAWDRGFSWLSLELTTAEVGDGSVAVSVDLLAFRSGILVPFRVRPVVVWRAGHLVVAEGRFSSRSKIREAVEVLADLLAEDCRKAAKLSAGDPRLRPILPGTEGFRGSTKDGGLGTGAGAQRPKSSRSFSDR